MGLPSINITFQTTAAASINRSQKGIVGLILRDENTEAQGKGFTVRSAADIPTTLDAANAAYIKRAMLGYINPPRKVEVFVVAMADETLTTGMTYFETRVVDYLCGPHDCAQTQSTAIATWVKQQRANDSIVKAVLPSFVADAEGVINFATTGIKDATGALTNAEFCSRIAGLIAGTPMTISCTYAPLPELVDIQRLNREEGDAAANAGKFILIHDGEKVKVGLGVNSLTTTTQEKGASFKKVKIVEAVDMIGRDIRMTCADNYIGKYANSYENKCVLISAIKGYLEGLEMGGILDRRKSHVDIDSEAQRAYLTAKGIDTEAMSEQEIREANTDDQVFIAISVKILDAIEQISIRAKL